MNPSPGAPRPVSLFTTLAAGAAPHHTERRATRPWPARLVDPDSMYPTTLEGTLRDELVYLWEDLHHAIEHAHNGCWSTACESLTYRIVALTRVTTALPWEAVQVRLVRSGVYERIHREAGLEHPPIDWADVEAFEHLLARDTADAERRPAR